MRKSKLASLTGLATLWAGLLVATPAPATVLGGPSGVGQAAKTIDPIAKVDWGWDNGDLYCNDGVRGEAEDYGYCAVCEYNKDWWESYGKLHPELWSKWKTSSAVGRVRHDRVRDDRVRDDRVRDDRIRDHRVRNVRIRDDTVRNVRFRDVRVRNERVTHDRVRADRVRSDRVHPGGRVGGGRVGGGRVGGGRVGGGGGHGGGNRRSDIHLKHDVALLGRLDNGLGYYRFSYNGSDQAYVGVIAQDVQSVRPEAVMRGHDGYLWVNYDRLGLRLMTWEQWQASGARIPAPTTRN